MSPSFRWMEVIVPPPRVAAAYSTESRPQMLNTGSALYRAIRSALTPPAFFTGPGTYSSSLARCSIVNLYSASSSGDWRSGTSSPSIAVAVQVDGAGGFEGAVELEEAGGHHGGGGGPG